MKNKKHKKRTYEKTKKPSCVKTYFRTMAGQLKRPVEKQGKWIDRTSVILAVIFGIVMAGTAVYSFQTADKGQEWLWLAVVFTAAAVLVNLFRFRYSAFLEMLLAAFCSGGGVYAGGKLYPSAESDVEGPVILNLVMYYLFFGVLFVYHRKNRYCYYSWLTAAGCSRTCQLFCTDVPFLTDSALGSFFGGGGSHGGG